MDRSTAPFKVGDEVVCVDDSCIANVEYEPKLAIQEGRGYIVKDIRKGCCSWEVDIGAESAQDGMIDMCPRCGFCENGTKRWWFLASRFRKINPYQSSVSRELAERAVESIGDGQDMKPVKVKEVENAG